MVGGVGGGSRPTSGLAASRGGNAASHGGVSESSFTVETPSANFPLRLLPLQGRKV